jgi:hypothetical protein
MLNSSGRALTYSCARQCAAILKDSKLQILRAMMRQTRTMQQLSSVNYQNIPEHHTERIQWKDEAMLYVHVSAIHHTHRSVLYMLNVG